MDKLKYFNLSQQTQDIDPMLDQCCATVYDAGSTLVQHWVDVSCLPGMGMNVPARYPFGIDPENFVKTNSKVTPFDM